MCFGVVMGIIENISTRAVTVGGGEVASAIK